jgi:hypothetical protein
MPPKAEKKEAPAVSLGPQKNEGEQVMFVCVASWHVRFMKL